MYFKGGFIPGHHASMHTKIYPPQLPIHMTKSKKNRVLKTKSKSKNSKTKKNKLKTKLFLSMILLY
jgi:hypothetical protein